MRSNDTLIILNLRLEGTALACAKCDNRIWSSKLDSIATGRSDFQLFIERFQRRLLLHRLVTIHDVSQPFAVITLQLTDSQFKQPYEILSANANQSQTEQDRMPLSPNPYTHSSIPQPA